MSPVTHRFGWYLAVLQLLFTLCWTVYAIYLPQLATAAGLAPGAVVILLLLDQVVFTVCDFATGIVADRTSRALIRIGPWLVAITVVSCAAFLVLPYVAAAGAPLLIAVTAIWTITTSALRAPPMMMLGKHAARPAIPYLTSLALLGYGLAGAASPYLAATLRQADPRLPFALASLVLVLAASGLIRAERRLASQPNTDTPSTAPAPVRTVGPTRPPTLWFALAMIALALGYQIHFSLESAPLYRRFAAADQLVWLMPVFWIGFNVTMFPASVLTRKFGGYVVIGVSSLIGAAAIAVAHGATTLTMLVVAQCASGAAWGAILMSAFAIALSATGKNGEGREGRMSGLLYATLALATLARIGAVASGVAADPHLVGALQGLPVLCWALAGLTLLYVAASSLMRRASATAAP
ncbi:MAG: MFS transporter [Rhodopseudomonas sp.]|nr:MFS transporter [Rhodopseudomonas sp.]